MLSVDVQMEPFYVRDFTLRCVGFVMISGSPAVARSDCRPANRKVGRGDLVGRAANEDSCYTFPSRAPCQQLGPTIDRIVNW